MSQLVRLEGKHSTQNAHCAVYCIVRHWVLFNKSSDQRIIEFNRSKDLDTTALPTFCTYAVTINMAILLAVSDSDVMGKGRPTSYVFGTLPLHNLHSPKQPKFA